MEEHALDQKTEGHGAPVEHEDGGEGVLLADAQRDGDRHGHERGGDRVFQPAPPSEGVVELPPVPEPVPLEGAHDARPEVEECRRRKPRDDERRKVDGVSVVAQEEAVVLLRVGEVPARRPLGDVVLDHVGRGDLRDAVDAHGEVLVLRHRVAVPAPVGKVERHEDHGRVHDQAEEV